MSEQLVPRDPWIRDDRTWQLVRLLIECRDALPAISEVSRRLHNISPTLADRIDASIEPWRSDSPGCDMKKLICWWLGHEIKATIVNYKYAFHCERCGSPLPGPRP